MPSTLPHALSASSKRRWIALCAAMILTLLAAGCGGGGEEAEPADTAAEPTAGTAAPGTGEPGTGEPATGDATTPADGATAAAGCEGAAALEGEQLEIAIPFPPGGGFDRQARLIGDALAEEFGIVPVPVNETGAGGLLTLNQNVTTDPEKLRIQYVQTPAAVAAQLAGAEGANFSLEEWPWLARVTIDPQIAIASTESGFETLQDAFSAEQPPRIGALGPGGIDYLHAQVLPALFDSQADVVTGFGSPAEAVLSVTNGDIDMYVLDERALLPAVEAGDVVPLAHIAREASDNLPDLPVITEIIDQGSEGADLLDDYLNLIEIGRAFAAVPGASEERVETLRCMLEVVLTHPDVVSDIEQPGDQMAYLPGEEMQASIEEAMQAGEEFVGLMEQSF